MLHWTRKRCIITETCLEVNRTVEMFEAFESWYHVLKMFIATPVLQKMYTLNSAYNDCPDRRFLIVISEYRYRRKLFYSSIVTSTVKFYCYNRNIVINGAYYVLLSPHKISGMKNCSIDVLQFEQLRCESDRQEVKRSKGQPLGVIVISRSSYNRSDLCPCWWRRVKWQEVALSVGRFHPLGSVSVEKNNRYK